MVVIVDYGMGNLRSVQKAGEFAGKKIKVTDSGKIIKKAKKIILPGVAHFGRTVKELKKRKLFNLLKEMIRDGVPFLGVCVGMQLLLDESEEAKGIKGLGIIKGKVKKFTGKNLIVPHMGWNQVKIKIQNSKIKIQKSTYGGGSSGGKIENRDLFKGINNDSYFYFANSYYCAPQEKETVLAVTEYGREFASALHKENIWAVQFHPEKSQKLGLRLFKNFLCF